MSYLVLYLLTGLMFWVIMFTVELLKFIKEERDSRNWHWPSVIHGFFVVLAFWPWAVPFYFYERIR
jgi:hypothetical protein